MTTGSPLPSLTPSVTALPSWSRAPPPGACVRTVPAGSKDCTSSPIGVKFACASFLSASSIGRPTTSGTGPVSGGGGASKPSDREARHRLDHEVVPDRRGHGATEHRPSVVRVHRDLSVREPDPDRRRDLRRVAGEVHVRVVLRGAGLPGHGSARMFAAVPGPAAHDPLEHRGHEVRDLGLDHLLALELVLVQDALVLRGVLGDVRELHPPHRPRVAALAVVRERREREPPCPSWGPPRRRA